MIRWKDCGKWRCSGLILRYCVCISRRARVKTLNASVKIVGVPFEGAFRVQVGADISRVKFRWWPGAYLISDWIREMLACYHSSASESIPFYKIVEQFVECNALSCADLSWFLPRFITSSCSASDTSFLFLPPSVHFPELCRLQVATDADLTVVCVFVSSGLVRFQSRSILHSCADCLLCTQTGWAYIQSCTLDACPTVFACLEICIVSLSVSLILMSLRSKQLT